jgi:hypothetical protein
MMLRANTTLNLGHPPAEGEADFLAAPEVIGGPGVFARCASSTARPPSADARPHRSTGAPNRGYMGLTRRLGFHLIFSDLGSRFYNERVPMASILFSPGALRS